MLWSGYFILLLRKCNRKHGVRNVLTASIITNTLSFVVGFEGSMPRKERNDFPDCWWDIFHKSYLNYEILLYVYIYVQVDTIYKKRM